jgi:hypothetical protein
MKQFPRQIPSGNDIYKYFKSVTAAGFHRKRNSKQALRLKKITTRPECIQ